MTRKHPRRNKKHDADERRVEQISAALKGYYTEKEVRELLQQKREAEQAALKEQRVETLKKQAEEEPAWLPLGTSRMGGQDRNPGDQGGRHCANEYCNDEWKRFPQLCAHRQFPHPQRRH